MRRNGPFALILACLLGCPNVLPAQEVSVITSAPAAEGNQSVPLWRLPIDVSVSVNTGYDENVNTSDSNSEGSFFTGASIGLSYNFGTERTRASLSTGTGFTYYPELDENRYDPDLNLSLSVNHPVNLRLTLILFVSASYRAEPDFSSDLGVNRRGGNYFTTNDTISGAYQWLPRFSTVSAYSLGAIIYDAEEITVAQNRTDHGFSQSFRFLYLPVTTVVLDFRYSFVSFQEGGRGSDSQSILVGIDHTFSPLLNGTIRAGAEFRTSEGGVLSDDSSGTTPHVEGSLSYALGGKSSVNWTLSYSTEESDVIVSPGRQTFRTGLALSYAFTARISGSLSGNYSHDVNEGPSGPFFSLPSFSEDSIDVSVNFRYAITPSLNANAGYGHTEVSSELALRSYIRNRYFGGLTFTF